ncbi:ATP-binding protein [Streptomyces sp. Da 82-17]|uniref:ATP-binding protein n=1 Tax=Streptomyces sp. Da 82-17 TaxID=3377116 RepID=UPI0038D4B99C
MLRWGGRRRGALEDVDVREEGLVGREQELALLEQALAEHRLVTVCGRAGVGKSRLAAEALGAVRGAEVVRLRWQGGPGTPETLLARVRQAFTGAATTAAAPGRDPGPAETASGVRGGLLFLDDIDPVHRAGIQVVQHLLMSVPRLRILVTSRRALGLGDERVLTLAPLTVEAADAAAEPEAGAAVEPEAGAAVELFLRRAREEGADCAGSGADLRAVGAICRALEGVPHAVELAARQAARMGLHRLAEVVQRRQCWLDRSGGGLRRHRSVRAAVGASYGLCERPARMVWSRAAMFGGAFDQTSAVLLCTGGEVLPHQVPSLLAELASVHVLEPVDDPGGPRVPRYRMTRAAREFGVECLREAGEWEATAELHLANCRKTAAVASHLWLTGHQRQAVRLVHEQHDDLAAMVRYAQDDPARAEPALGILVGVWFWWAAYGRAEEGLDLLQRLLPLCPADSEVTRRGRWLAAWLCAGSDPDAARQLLSGAWELAVVAGDDATVGQVAHVEGVLALYEGDHRTAAAHFHAAAHTTPPDSPAGPSHAVSMAALAIAQSGHDPRAAHRTARRALAQPGVRDDPWAGALTHYARAFVEHRNGRSGRALHRARRTLAALDTAAPRPLVGEALRCLISDIEAHAVGHVFVPKVSLPTSLLPWTATLRAQPVR